MEELFMSQKMKCQICGYTYDPDKGDGEGVAPGTAFEDLPPEWRCIQCRAAKTKFKAI